MHFSIIERIYCFTAIEITYVSLNALHTLLTKSTKELIRLGSLKTIYTITEKNKLPKHPLFCRLHLQHEALLFKKRGRIRFESNDATWTAWDDADYGWSWLASYQEKGNKVDMLLSVVICSWYVYFFERTKYIYCYLTPPVIVQSLSRLRTWETTSGWCIMNGIKKNPCYQKCMTPI